jgi:outer membrane protein insertion porin family
MKQAGLTKGDPLDPISINSAKSRLIEFYQDKGMNQVDIQVRSGLKPGERDVDFVISEGPVERLNDVKILGNKVYSSDLLYAKLKNKGSRYGLTKYLFNVVSDNKIEDDRQLLMGYYRQLGYFDARVDFRKDYNEAGDFVDVTFIIFEGERYKVRSVSITGTKRYQASELLPHMKSKEGAYFSLIDKSKDERFIYELYGVQGHYFCDVVGELVYQPGNQVDIIYNVGEGDIYRISDVRVHLEGDYTKERVVLQPLAGLRPGSILNSVKVEEGTRRLKATTLFNVDPSQGILPSLKVEPPEDVDSIDR